MATQKYIVSGPYEQQAGVVEYHVADKGYEGTGEPFIVTYFTSTGYAFCDFCQNNSGRAASTSCCHVRAAKRAAVKSSTN